MKSTTNQRRALLFSLLASSTLAMSTGCSSSGSGFTLASMNPFSRSTVTTEPAGPTEPTLTQSIASSTAGATKQIGAVGVSAKNAIGKTSNAVAGVFRRDSADSSDHAATDPLTLTDEPAKIGPEVFVANGQLWESTGNFQKAMESYSKALENTPNDAAALTSIARLHFRQGSHPQAAEFFQKAVQANPTDAALYNDFGLTLSKLGKHDEASSMLTKSLELAPGTSRYANNLASVRFESGDTVGAFDVLQKNNKPAVAHFNMAYLHYSKNQIEPSRQHLAEALKFEPQASSDAAVRRAVDRSREMLAQLSGSSENIANIAQAVPDSGTQPQTVAPVAAPTSMVPYANTTANATTASGSANGSGNSGVPASTAGYRPGATPWAPAMASITQPPRDEAPVCENGSCSLPSSQPGSPTGYGADTAGTPSTNIAESPQWGPSTWSASGNIVTSGQTKPVQPVSGAIESSPPATSSSSAPAAPTFSLPDGFTMPGAN